MNYMWVTYSVKYGGGPQFDPLPNTYYNVSFHNNELSALRWANAKGAKVILITRSGMTLDEAIQQAAR